MGLRHDRPWPEKKLILQSLHICTIDINCCAIAFVQSYDGAIFVARTILCGTSVVYGVYFVISGVFLKIPFSNSCPIFYEIHVIRRSYTTRKSTSYSGQLSRNICSM